MNRFGSWFTFLGLNAGIELMRPIAATFAVAGLLAQQVIAQSDPAILAQPDGKWIVDFADDYCLAGHKFRTAYGETILQILPDMLRQHATIRIIVPQSDITDREWGQIKVDWPGRDQKQGSTRLYRVVALPDNKRLLEFSIGTDEAIASDPFNLSVAFSRNPGFAFHLSGWAELQSILDQCASDLRKSKGYPGDEYYLATRHAKGDVISHVGIEDYPGEALAKNEQGEAWVIFWVETNGKVSDCVIERSSGSKSLDAQTCRVVKRVHFEPALGPDHKPIREPYSTRLSWWLPAD